MKSPQTRLKQARRELNAWMRKNYNILYILSSETRRWAFRERAFREQNSTEYPRLISKRGYFDKRVERIHQAEYEISQSRKTKTKTK